MPKQKDDYSGITIGGIPLTEENYLSFRKAYRKALKDEKTEFVWEGQDFIMDFAKYVLESMETYPIIKPLKEG